MEFVSFFLAEGIDLKGDGRFSIARGGIRQYKTLGFPCQLPPSIGLFIALRFAPEDLGVDHVATMVIHGPDGNWHNESHKFRAEEHPDSPFPGREVILYMTLSLAGWWVHAEGVYKVDMIISPTVGARADLGVKLYDEPRRPEE